MPLPFELKRAQSSSATLVLKLDDRTDWILVKGAFGVCVCLVRFGAKWQVKNWLGWLLSTAFTDFRLDRSMLCVYQRQPLVKKSSLARHDLLNDTGAMTKIITTRTNQQPTKRGDSGCLHWFLHPECQINKAICCKYYFAWSTNDNHWFTLSNI